VAKRTTEEIQQRIADSRKKTEAKTASDARLKPHLDKMPGPKPGGLAEAVNDPNYVQRQLDAAAKRREEQTTVKKAFGIRTPKHDADTPDNRVHFAEGAMADNPKVAIRGNPRFRK
jgi:hypothetical protein